MCATREVDTAGGVPDVGPCCGRYTYHPWVTYTRPVVSIHPTSVTNPWVPLRDTREKGVIDVISQSRLETVVETPVTTGLRPLRPQN